MRQRYSVLLIALFIAIPIFCKAQNAPLEFIENRGQWEGDFHFKAATSNGDIYLGNKSIMYVLGAAENLDKVDAYQHGQIKKPPTLNFHAYEVLFENANTANIKGNKKQTTYYNFFLGRDTRKWKTGIHPFLVIDYENLYDGITGHFYSEKGNLKYDFIAEPGADVSKIKLKFKGIDGLKLKDYNLVITTSVGSVTELKPYAYQYINGVRKEVMCKYVVKDSMVTFDFPKGYEKSEMLIIDPTVVFCTFTGSTADNWGFTATYDAGGNFYAGGLVHHFLPSESVTPGSFPVSPGAYQTIYHGGIQSGTFSDSTHGSDYACDIAIMKLDPTGANRIYATYIGGSDNEQPHSLIVDAAGNLLIAARTYSNDYPVTGTAFDQNYNGGGDIAITKLNAAGTGIIASTYLGGTKEDGINFNSIESVFGGLKHNYGDDARSEILIDNANNVYLTACTKSSDFPVTSNATQSSFQGEQDAIVAKLDPGLTTLTWSTYLGGSDNDAGYVLALDNSQTNIFVAGGTASGNFPSTTGTIWSSYQGGTADGFIAKFQNSAPYTLLKSTFIGQGDYDQVYGIQIDAANNIYVMGQTLGGTFPVSAGVYSNANSSQFILKTDANLSANLLSTVFGSGNLSKTNISPVAFLVDTCQNIYISGWGGGLGFSPQTVGTTTGLPITANAAQSTTDGSDFYFIVLTPNMQGLLYATYYGRSSTDPGRGEHVDGGTSRFDKSGVVYQAICGGCRGSGAAATPFPTTPGSWSPTNGSSNCNEVALKIAFQFTSPKAEASTTSDTIGCAPLVVKFENNSSNSLGYQWIFDDGSPIDTSFSPTHTFTTPGIHIVKLVAVNSGACGKTVDTDIIRIVVDSSSVEAKFDYNIVSSCDPYEVSFTNTSVFSNTPGSQNFTTFFWDFGDGNTFNGKTPPLHTYPDTGTYTVTMIMIDTSACNSPDTVQKTFTLSSEYVEAAFTPDSVCIGNSMLLANQSEHALTYTWAFGDGNTSNAASPTYTFAVAGAYTITLIAANPGTCNKFDTVTATVMVWPQPVANFSYDPVIPVPNEPIKFTNLSQNAQLYYWAFGDGTSSTEDHPSHLYKKTDRYKVCLEAKNEFGCLSQVCKFVDAEIYPAIDVPTGFSPNGDNSNDILYVRGAAVETLNFRVYNRWGEKVFETDDITQGWDGNYKGKPQEMEAYAWVLDATFVDGTSVHRTGNVTLLR